MSKLQDIDRTLLPQSIIELIEIIGLHHTLSLVRLRGGVRIYIPKQPDPEHWLNELIGQAAFVDLVTIYQGMELEIPRCHAALKELRDNEIYQAYQAGKSNAELALQFGYTERGICKVKQRVRQRLYQKAISPQQELF